MKNLDVRNPWDNKVFDTIKTESERKLKLSFLLLMVSLKKKDYFLFIKELKF